MVSYPLKHRLGSSTSLRAGLLPYCNNRISLEFIVATNAYAIALRPVQIHGRTSGSLRSKRWLVNRRNARSN